MYHRLIVWAILLLFLLIPLKFIYRYFELWQDELGVLKPNILLITIDTCRSDILGLYGNSRIYAPVLDRLAQKGVVFQRAYSPVPTTGPSHTTLLTGMSPAQHRVFRNGMTYSQRFKTLAELYRDAGYSTSAFISGYSLTNKMSGLGRGFNIYRDEWSSSRLEQRADQTIDLFCNWLRKDVKTPFLAWVHLFDLHSPYTPPEPFDSVLIEADLQSPKTFTDRQIRDYNRHVSHALEEKDFRVLVKDPTTTQADTESIIRNRALYEGELCFIDNSLQTLFEAMKSQQVFDQTLILVTSDHGEGFDHDYFFGHGDRLWESAVSVPLIIRYPRDKHRNTICNQIALLRDLLPTIKSISHFPILGHQNQGENLVQVIANQLPRQYSAWFTVAPPLPRKHLSQGLYIAAYDPVFKLIFNQSTQQSKLFNLIDDPGETRDVKDSYPAANARLLRNLKEHMRKGNYPVSDALIHSELREKEKLKQLGYIIE